MEKITGIYCIENILNSKKYIGQSVHIYGRIKRHEHDLRKGIDSLRLQRAFDKYGAENFRSYILETCDFSALNDREIYWISVFNSNNFECGYNITAGGRNGSHDEETIRKLSEMKKGTHLSEETKRKIADAITGKKRSDETRKKISEARKKGSSWLAGKHHTEEAKRKRSEKMEGENAHWFGKKQPNALSQYFGVRRINRNGRVYWWVGLKVNREDVYVGSAKSEIEAARMYDAYVIENNLPNPLNFPEE
jgi:group I intron endonuclease